MAFDSLNRSKLIAELIEFGATEENPMHAKLLLKKTLKPLRSLKTKEMGKVIN